MKEILRGDIWFVDLEPIRGSEQGGIRPCIVLQNDMGNRHSPTVIVAPITSRKKKTLLTHVFIETDALPYQSVVLLEQIRTVDKIRFLNYSGRISAAQMRVVERAINASLGMDYLEGLPHEK